MFGCSRKLRYRPRDHSFAWKGLTMDDDRAELTARQQQILDYLQTTVADRGYPPSVREIGEAVGLSSPSTVHSHLNSLVEAGYIRRDPSKPRAIEVLDVPESATLHRAPVRDVPLVGRIAAGSPILAEEDIDEIYPLPTELVGTDPVFMLQVKGDSMIDAGILDHDWVVVQRSQTARDGQLVAALIDGEEATVKRLQRKEGRVILRPENRDYPPMVFADGVEILGVVVAVLRRVT
jgi:repressor LexA